MAGEQLGLGLGLGLGAGDMLGAGLLDFEMVSSSGVATPLQDHQLVFPPPPPSAPTASASQLGAAGRPAASSGDGSAAMAVDAAAQPVEPAAMPGSEDKGVEAPVPAGRKSRRLQSKLRLRIAGAGSAAGTTQPAVTVIQDDEPEPEPEPEPAEEEAEEAEEAEEEIDDDTLYCVCKSRDTGRFMFACDGCNDWFHPKCVGMTKAQAENLDSSYFCSKCLALAAGTPVDEAEVADGRKRKREAADVAEESTARLTARPRRIRKPKYDDTEWVAVGEAPLPDEPSHASPLPEPKPEQTDWLKEQKQAQDIFALLLGGDAPGDDSAAAKPVVEAPPRPAPKPQPKAPPPADQLRFRVRAALAKVLRQRCGTKPEYEALDADQLALDIEAAMFAAQQGIVTKEYKVQYRSIHFNLKNQRNTHLFQRVASGDVSPQQLATMSKAEMADSDQIKARQAAEEDQLKNVIIQPEQLQVVVGNTKYVDRIDALEKKVERRTSKPVLADAAAAKKAAAAAAAAAPAAASAEDPSSQATGAADEEMSAEPERRQSVEEHMAVETTDVDAGPGAGDGDQTASVEAAVAQMGAESAQDESPSKTPTESPNKRRISLPARYLAPSASAKAASIASQPGTAVKSTTPPLSTEPVQWKGRLSMSHLTSVNVTARRAFGAAGVSLRGMVPSSVGIVGRIQKEQVWKYISKLKYSTGKQIIISVLEPTSEEDQVAYISLFEYLSSRQRYGVGGVKHPSIKDFYIVYLGKDDKLPETLTTCGLDGPGIPVIRQENRLLTITVHVSPKNPNKSKKRRHDRVDTDVYSPDSNFGKSPVSEARSSPADALYSPGVADATAGDDGDAAYRPYSPGQPLALADDVAAPPAIPPRPQQPQAAAPAQQAYSAGPAYGAAASAPQQPAWQQQHHQQQQQQLDGGYAGYNPYDSGYSAGQGQYQGHGYGHAPQPGQYGQPQRPPAQPGWGEGRGSGAQGRGALPGQFGGSSQYRGGWSAR